MIGDVIDANTEWWSGNWWPSSSGYVQDDLLYLGVRNTTIGDYYGYITFNYELNSVSLKSYTYENSGSAITVSAVPVPAAVWLFGSGLIGLVGLARRKKT